MILPIQSAVVESKKHIDVQRAVQYAKDLKSRGKNSYDSVRFPFNIYFLTDEVRVCSEAAPPESIAQDGNLVISDLLLLWKKYSPRLNLGAQQRQKRSRNSKSLNTLRLVSTRQIEIQEPPGCELFKKLGSDPSNQ